jgi:hypothetical protein
MNILEEANSLVSGDRQSNYGHPLDDFSRTAKMWSAILGVEISAEQVGLCMVAVKISRQVNKPKRDNLVDAAGYSATVQMCVDERLRREELKEELTGDVSCTMSPKSLERGS